ncbi:hypothetical protein EDD99_2644 [Streptomyces sp. 846.5]|nr:hypothetical protein EDD99_2644 [Streptomyces sp. 846.5]
MVGKDYVAHGVRGRQKAAEVGNTVFENQRSAA